MLQLLVCLVISVYQQLCYNDIHSISTAIITLFSDEYLQRFRNTGDKLHIYNGDQFRSAPRFHLKLYVCPSINFDLIKMKRGTFVTLVYIYTYSLNIYVSGDFCLMSQNIQFSFISYRSKFIYVYSHLYLSSELIHMIAIISRTGIEKKVTKG